MLTINLNKVRKVIQDSEQKPKPKMKISFGDSGTPDIPQQPKSVSESRRKVSEAKSPLSEQCWNQYNELRIEQAKVANEIHELVANGADRKAIKDLYDRVESYRPDLISAFERARYVDQHGKLPVVTNSVTPAADLYTLKDQKRKLIDKRCKLQRKIEKGKATNAPKLPEWEMELEHADMEYKSIDEQIKQLGGK